MKLNKFNDFFNCKVKARIPSRGKLKTKKIPLSRDFLLSSFTPAPARIPSHGKLKTKKSRFRGILSI